MKLAEAREKALGDLIKVDLKLSDKLFWWEKPIVCRWEPFEESDEFAQLDPRTQDFNLHYDEYVKTQVEKLFSAPNPRHYKKPIQLKDFDLTSPPEDIDRSALAKHYLVPMMPDEFKFFNEQLKIFEVKQREWRNILIAKHELNTSSVENLNEIFAQTWKEFSVDEVTVEMFQKFFDAKSFTPHNLFPLPHRKMIEALGDPETIKQIKDDREVFRKQNQPNFTEDVGIGELRPIKNEPIALSELLHQINKVEKSLQPFLWKVQEKLSIFSEGKSNLKHYERKSGVKPKAKFNRTSTWSQKSRELKLEKPRRRTRPSSRASGASLEKSINESAEENVDEKEEYPKAVGLIEHLRGKWSTRDIYEPSYDAQTKVVTFYTGSLGTFGLATRKYCNLPLRSWEIFPVTEDNNNFVVMKIVTQNVNVEVKVTNFGYTFQIVNMKKIPFEASKNSVKINELKKVMASVNINIFPEVDASWYVEKISEKHMAMEFHTYKSMAFYCLSHHFKSNVWNRWAHRRNAIFESRMIYKNVFTRVMTSPTRTASVNVREKCTPLDVVDLDYDLVPADQEVKY